MSQSIDASNALSITGHNPFDPGYLSESDLKLAGFRSLGRNVKVARSCTIIGLANIDLGSNVRIDGYSTIVAAGDEIVSIGSYVHIAGYCGLYGSHGITMEDFSGLSSGIRIYSGTDDYSGHFLTNPTVPSAYSNVKSGKVTLGRHVIVGAGTLILPGVSIGAGSAVGAMSLVSKSLDEWGIYAGCPVRRLKARSTELLTLEAQLLAEKQRLAPASYD